MERRLDPEIEGAARALEKQLIADELEGIETEDDGADGAQGDDDTGDEVAEETAQASESGSGAGCFAAGGYTLVKISDLKLPADRLRQKQPDPERLRRLQESMRKEGLLQPVLITRSNEVVVGTRRVMAAPGIGWTHLACLVVPDGVDPKAAEFVSNDTFEDVDVVDRAQYVAALVESGKTQDEVAEIIHRSQPTVSFLLFVDRLSQKQKKRIRAGELSATAAVKQENADPEVRKEVERKLQAGERVKIKDVDPSRKSICVPPEALPEGVQVRIFRDRVRFAIDVPIGKGQRKALSKCPVVFNPDFWANIAASIPVAWVHLP